MPRGSPDAPFYVASQRKLSEQRAPGIRHKTGCGITPAVLYPAWPPGYRGNLELCNGHAGYTTKHYAVCGISGDPSPSSPDVHVTRVLRDAAKTVEITLLDHVILGRPEADPLGRGYYSFREGGLI